MTGTVSISRKETLFNKS